MPGLSGVRLVAGGWRHMLAADVSGALWAWGWNKFGQLGLGHNQELISAPQRVEVGGWLGGWVGAAAGQR